MRNAWLVIIIMMMIILNYLSELDESLRLVETTAGAGSGDNDGDDEEAVGPSFLTVASLMEDSVFWSQLLRVEACISPESVVNWCVRSWLRHSASTRANLVWASSNSNSRTCKKKQTNKQTKQTVRKWENVKTGLQCASPLGFLFLVLVRSLPAPRKETRLT